MLPSIFSENLFDDMFNSAFNMFPEIDRTRYGNQARNVMKTDVRETDSSYLLDVDLPGFKKDEVKLELKEGYLTITAAKNVNNDQKDQEGHYIRQERYTGQVCRSFYVGEAVRPEDLHAKFEDGILQITVPKQPQKMIPESTYIDIE